MLRLWKKGFFLVAPFAILILAGCSNDLVRRAATEQFVPKDTKSNLRLTYFGTSSFLIEDDSTQLLIDGFFSPRRRSTLGRIAPEKEKIDDILKSYGICMSSRFRFKRSNPDTCRKTGKSLSYVIPVHAHYDHALDAPYVAALSGATLIGGESVQAAAYASARYQPLQSKDLDWKTLIIQKPFEPEQRYRTFTAGAFTITLVRTRHSKNVTSHIVSGETAEFDFPTRLWTMKEGTNFSVHIRHRNRGMLFVPTAGEIDSEFLRRSLSAKVAFIGIGGLGVESKNVVEKYWKNTVDAVKADYVVPIHWDDDRHRVPDLKNGQFTPAMPRNPDATLRRFDLLAENSDRNVVIRFAPPGVPFDPFSQ